MPERKGNAVAEKTAEERLAAHRETAERLLQEQVLPAFATVRDELHRPEQQVYVTVTPRSPTAAELTISRTPPTAGADVPLRYAISIAVGSQASVGRRSVNGKAGSFLGQHFATSLRQQVIVDDVRRVWRRVEKKREGAGVKPR